MLIDLHAHSSGISKCCKIPIERVLQAAMWARLDGIVLTNHYQKNYVADGDFSAFAKRYVQEYVDAVQCSREMGCRVFFGIEVTMEQYPGVHLLIYGVDTAFLEANPTLFDLSQEALYRLVKAHGGIVVQAHPFRKNLDRLLDPTLLDGVEISCHPLYESTHLARLSAIASEHGLFLTCGGDYHADTHRPHCGVYLPDHLKSSEEIAQYLTAADTIRLCVQEVDENISHDVVFRRMRSARESEIRLETMCNFFTARAADYDAHMLGEVEGCKEGYRAMARLVPKDTKRLLDLGCGTGLELDEIFQTLPDIAVTGVDMTAAMLERLRQKHPAKALTLLCEDYFTADFGKGYDVAVSFETMHHFSHERKLALYRKLHAALTDTGCYIECDYMVDTGAEEKRFFAEAARLRCAAGVDDNVLYHIDTPCAVKTQIALLETAGFVTVKEVFRQGNTVMLIAKK